MAASRAKPRGPVNGGKSEYKISKHAAGAQHMTDDQLHHLLRVRDIGISESQMSDSKILTVLHDNGNDVANLASMFYDGEQAGFRACGST